MKNDKIINAVKVLRTMLSTAGLTGGVEAADNLIGELKIEAGLAIDSTQSSLSSSSVAQAKKNLGV